MKMEDTMVDISSSVQNVEFFLPEAPYGGMLRDLFKQYREEMWKERVAISADNTGMQHRLVSNEDNSKVCFLIRTSIRDDPQRTVRSVPTMKEMNLASLIQCTF